MKHIKDLTASQLLRLRKEIVLNSLYLRDYENSFGIDQKEVCNFFEGYVEYLYEVAGHEDIWLDIFDLVKEYDNKQNLQDWHFICQSGYAE